MVEMAIVARRRSNQSSHPTWQLHPHTYHVAKPYAAPSYTCSGEAFFWLNTSTQEPRNCDGRTPKKSYTTSCWCLLSLDIVSALCHLDVVLHHMKFPSCTCPINFGESLNPTISMEMFRCGCDATSEVETEKGSMEKNTRAPHTALAADNF